MNTLSKYSASILLFWVALVVPVEGKDAFAYQYPENPPPQQYPYGYQPQPAYPQQPVQYGRTCYTQYTACALGQPLPVGSPCACYTPYGQVGGRVGQP